MSRDEPTREELLRHVAEMNAELISMRERVVESKDQADWAIDSVKARTKLLNERVKELACVYEAFRVFRDPDLRPEQRIGRIVDLLPRAFQHAGDACARATLGGKEYRTSRFQETEWRLEERVLVKGEAVGTLQVFYAREFPEADEGPFLREERLLLRVVAEALGAVAELG